MNGTVKLGAFLILVGFLMVGGALVYGTNTEPKSLQDAVQITRNAETLQGIGWIVGGIGLTMSVAGLAAGIHSLATVVPDISALGTTEPVLKARKVSKEFLWSPKFVCSDCGADIDEKTKVCPKCGAAIEGS